MDGLSLTIGGAALTTIGGVVGAWIKAKYSQTRINGGSVTVGGIPQPLTVQGQTSLCEERHGGITKDLENIFAPSPALEKAQAAYDATIQSLKSQITSMDSKLDRLLSLAK